MRPSDFYAAMLNELETLLSARKIPTRIVFLIYVDLLWPPAKIRIKNQARFTLMFAPITRSFQENFDRRFPPLAIPPYRRNKLKFPNRLNGNVALLRGWQSLAKTDGFDFDYHLWSYHYEDPGYMRVSETIHRDIRGLKKLGLNGFMSCQTQRASFPTGLPTFALGRTLWNRDAKFIDIVKDYFANAFGPDWPLCVEYLTRFSHPATQRDALKTKTAVKNFLPIIARNLTSQSTCRAYSWKYLEYHATIRLGLAGVRTPREEEEMGRRIWRMEPFLNPVFDVYLFTPSLHQLVARQA